MKKDSHFKNKNGPPHSLMRLFSFRDWDRKGEEAHEARMNENGNRISSITKIMASKKTIKQIFIAGAVFGFSIVSVVSATPAFAYYTPGATLNPSCAPSDPTCTITLSSSSGALYYASGQGLNLNTSTNVFGVVLDGSTLTQSGNGLKLSDSYAGQDTIATLGTVTTGTWEGATIGVLYGGTGVTTAPTTGQLLIGNSTGGYSVANLTSPANSGITVTNGSGTLGVNLDFTNLGDVSSLANTDYFLVNASGTNKKISFNDLANIWGGALRYEGSWDPTTVAPTTCDASTNGYYYIASTATAASPVSGLPTWNTGDWLVCGNSTSSPSTWDRIQTTNNITSVFGRTGTVTASAGDYNALQITFNNASTSGAISATNVQDAINQLAANSQLTIATGTTGQYYRGDKTWQTLDTSAVTENAANLYYTDARSRSAISSANPALVYTTSTGVLALGAGYSIPLTASTTNWENAYEIVNASSSSWITSTTPYLAITQNGLYLASSTPSSTANTLYAQGNNLYWAGNQLGIANTQNGNTTGDILYWNGTQWAPSSVISFSTSTNTFSVAGNTNLATTTVGTLTAGAVNATGLAISTNGIAFGSSTPTSASDTLYSVGDNLYWNGTQIANTSSSGAIGGTVAGALPTGILYTDASGTLVQDTANFSYDPTTSKLHVSGGIDPVYTSVAATGTNANAYYEAGAGQNAAVAASNMGRLRYNATTGNWESSVNGGAYTAILTASSTPDFLNLTWSNATGTNLTVLGTTNLATTTVGSLTSGDIAAGNVSAGNVTASGLTVAANGIAIAASSSAPTTTTGTLYSVGGSLYWNGSALGVAGAGLQSINGLTGNNQLLAVGNAGTDFAIVSSGTTHTFNIPDASALARGLVTTSTQVFAGDKTFLDTTAFNVISSGTWNGSPISYLYGGTGITSTPQNGQILIGNGTGYALKTLAAATGTTLTNASGTLTLGLDMSQLVEQSSMANSDDLIYYSSSTGLNRIQKQDVFDGLLGALNYRGTWDPTTSLSATCATSTKGYYYVAATSTTSSVAISGQPTWNANDWAVCDGTTWGRIQTSNAVSSVFGRTGAITAQNNDYSALQIGFTPTSSLVSTNVQSAIKELADRSGAAGTSAGQILVWNGVSWTPTTTEALAGNLSVAGNTSLATTTISALSFANATGTTFAITGASTLGTTSITGLTVSGTTSLATTTAGAINANGLTISSNGLTITSSTPATTANTLYAQGSGLYWNGSIVTPPNMTFSNVVTGSASTFATVGSHPVALISDSAGNLYVANQSSGTISKITSAGAVTTAWATVGSNPDALAFDSAGNLYVANVIGSSVSKITSAGAVTVTWVLVGSSPDALAFDSAGNLYTANSNANTVSKITPAGVVTVVWANVGSQPNALAFDSAGNLYTANTGNNTVSKITPAGVVTTFATVGSSPDALAFDSAGNLYTANSGSNTISKITPAGVVTLAWATVGTTPQALAFDSAGNLYVANSGSNTVSKITSAGVVTTFATVGSWPDALAFDPAGSLYSANYSSNTVSKIINTTANTTIYGNTTNAGQFMVLSTTTLQDLIASGITNLATTTASGLTISTNGIVISSSTPATTTQALYALGNNLYWNGIQLGAGSLAGSSTLGYLPVWNGTSTLGTSSIYFATSTGNIGIGTTTASNALTIQAASDPLRLVGLTSQSAASSYSDLVIDANGVVRKAPVVNSLASVLDNTVTVPPTANVGDAYIVPASSTGVWATSTNDIATWDGSVWNFYVPSTNDRTLVTSGPNAGSAYVYGTSTWSAVAVAPSTNWLTGGNVASSSFLQLGTISNTDLSFITSSTERMRLSALGTLSLGTNATSALLTLQGLTTSSSMPLLNIASSSGLSLVSVSSGGGITLASSSPATSTNTLYNLNGTLYWNGLALGGSSATTIVTSSVSTSLTSTAFASTQEVSAASSSVTLTLPTAVGYSGRSIEFVKTDNTTNYVMIQPTSSQRIASSTYLYLYSQNDAVTLRSDGANWQVVSDSRQNAGANAQYGENNGITDSQTTNSTSFVDITGSSFTLPSAGTWKVNYILYPTTNIEGGSTYAEITDASNNVIANSIAVTTVPIINGNYNLSQSVYITTTAATTYKLKWHTNNGTVSLYNGVLGNSKVSWQQVTSVPNVTNSVDYLYAKNSTAQTLTSGSALTFDTTVNGNITKSGNNTFTLLAGKTYRLEGSVGGSNASAGQVFFEWRDTTNNVYIGNEAMRQPATSGSTAAEESGNAVAIYTPTTNVTVQLWARTTSSYTWGQGAIDAADQFSWIQITQIGSTASTGVALNYLTGALASGALDNTNYAQSWNWSTATSTATSSGMLALSANSLASGNLLYIDTHAASSSANALAINGSMALMYGTDFAPTTTYANNVSFGSTASVRVSSTLSSFVGITGIAGGTNGRLLTIVNASTTQSFTLFNQNASSTAANRIITGTGSDLTVAGDATILLSYDASASRWRVVGGTGGSSQTTIVTQSVSTALASTAFGSTQEVSAASGNDVITLPSAASNSGKSIEFVKTDNSANTVMLQGVSSQTIGGNLYLWLYNQNDAVTLRSDGTNWAVVSDNRSSVGQSAAYMYGVRTTAQTTGLTTGNPIMFTQVNSQNGSDVSLNTGTGVITLQAGKTYELQGTAQTIKDSGSAVSFADRWYNNTAGAYIGSTGQLTAVGAANFNADNGGVADAIITATTTITVQLNITTAGNVSQIGGSADEPSDYPWFTIKELSTPQTVINTVDYLSVNPTGVSGSYVATFTNPVGNMSYTSSTGSITLIAGKTYELEASTEVTASGQYSTIQWFNKDTGVALPGANAAKSQNSGVGAGLAGNQVARATFTPTVNTNVAVHIQDNTTVGSNSYIVVTQIGSTAYTGNGLPMNSLGNAIANGSLDNANYSQNWNWSTATSTTAMTLQANALTSGGLLSLTSNSSALNSTNGLLYVANNGTSTAGMLASFVTPSSIASSTGLYITNNGYVGIGTSTPSSALTVAGSLWQGIGTSTQIKQIATTTVGAAPHSIAISGRYAYVVNGTAGTVSVVDVSNPSAPSQIATTSVGGTGATPGSIAVSGRYAYVSNGGFNSISVIDISNPSAPSQIATTSVGGGPNSIAISGRYAYTTNGTANTIAVVDLSNSAAPLQIATTSVGAAPDAIAISGRYAYVTNANSNTISVVDVSNPSAPTQIATTTVGTQPDGIAISGRYAYVANYASGTISVVDISNPSVPLRIATIAAGGSPIGIAISGRYVYVVLNGGAVSVFDVSKSAAPFQVATTSVGVGPIAIAVSGRYAYVTNSSSNTISVIDLGGSDIGNLVAGSLEAGGLQVLNDITAQGNINAGTSLTIGSGGILSNGGVAISIASASSTATALDINNVGQGLSMSVQGAVAFQGVTYNATGTQNNVNFGNTSLVKITSTSTLKITGVSDLTGTSTVHQDGQLLTIMNLSTSTTVTLSNQSASSSAKNQIITGTGSDLVMAAGASISLQYDGTTNVWRVIGGTGGSSQTTIVATATSTTLAATAFGSTQEVSAASANVIITLPDAANQSGKSIEFVKTDNSANDVMIQGFGGDQIASTTYLFLYSQNDAVTLRSDGANWQIVSDNRSSVGASASYYQASANTTQSVSTAGTAINFAAASSASYGSDITFNGTNTFTLKAGKTYRLVGNFGYILSSASGYAKYQWKDMTQGVFVGDTGQIDTDSATTNGAPSKLDATAIVTPTTDTTYQLQTVAVQNITTVGQLSGPTASAYIQVISAQQNTVNTVDYIYANRNTSQTGIAAGTDIAFNNVVTGNIPLNTTTGVFTLTAGKTYDLEASTPFQTYSTSNAYEETSWVDATTNTLLVANASGICQPTTDTGQNSNNCITKIVYTPTTNQTVKLRVTHVSTGATAQLADATSNGLILNYAKITQIGSTASTGLTMNYLVGALAAGSLDNTNYNQTWNWSTATSTATATSTGLLTLTANSLTTGSLLALTSNSTALNSTNGLLYVANNGTSTAGMLASFVANTSSTGSGLYILANGSVGIGTSTTSGNSLTLTNGLTLNSAAPTVVANTLYAQGSGLYWNGSIVNSSNMTFGNVTAGTYPSTGSVSTFATISVSPTDLAFDSAGNLYIANNGTNTVSKVTPAGVVTTAWATVGSYPNYLAFDSAGNLYVTNYLDNTVSKVTPAGVVTTAWATVGTNPEGLAFDSAGNLYVANHSDNTVSKVTPAGVVTTAWATVGSYPAGLAFDSAGNLYVTNRGDGTVSKITPAGAVTLAWATVGTNPQALAFDSAGNLYVTNRGDGTVSKITPAGVVTLAWATVGSGSAPAGLAFDSAGNLYVANNGTNTVSKITGITNPSANTTIYGNTLNSGQLAVLSSATSSIPSEIITNNSAAPAGLQILMPNGVTGNSFITFSGSTATMGSVAVNAANASVLYNTASDRRLKTNIATTTMGLSQLMEISVDNFVYASDPTQTMQTGFIAQDLENVFPDAVTTNGDDGIVPLGSTSTPWQVDYGRVTPLIVAGIQDLNNLIFATSSPASFSTTTLANLMQNSALSLSDKVGFIASSTTAMQTTLASTTADIATLKTEIAAALSRGTGSVTISALNDLSLSGALSVTGHVTLGADTVGETTLAAGNTSTTITFTTPYGSKPIVTISPEGEVNGSYWIANATSTGFSIVTSQPQTSDVSFSWHAFAEEGNAFTVTPAASSTSTASSTTSDASSTTAVASANSTSTAILNVTFTVNGGTASPSDFTVSVLATNPTQSSFQGNASGTTITIDANKSYHANVSDVDGYTIAKNGCDDTSGSGAPAGMTVNCAITATAKQSAPVTVASSTDATSSSSYAGVGVPSTVSPPDASSTTSSAGS